VLCSETFVPQYFAKKSNQLGSHSYSLPEEGILWLYHNTLTIDNINIKLNKLNTFLKKAN
jgi:hypothetical protein